MGRGGGSVGGAVASNTKSHRKKRSGMAYLFGKKVKEAATFALGIEVFVYLLFANSSHA